MKIKVTDDINIRAAIEAALIENGGFCPCQLEQNEDTKCICKDFLEQSSGACHCGLYVKVND